MNQLSTKANLFKEVAVNLKTLMEKKCAALPKDLNQIRFLENCMTVLQETNDIEKCHPMSIARTMLKGAILGLDFFWGECYAIPYAGELTFQTDYKGEMKLAKKYSMNRIKDIYAKVVHEGDDLSVGVHEGKQYLNFIPVVFNDKQVLGAFAIVYFEDGSMMYDLMSVLEIQQTRKNYSKVPNGPAWTKSPEEMYKKTVLRRLLKLVELNFENEDQDKAFDDGGDLRKDNQVVDASAQAVDPFDEPVDANKPQGNLPPPPLTEDQEKELWETGKVSTDGKPVVNQ